MAPKQVKIASLEEFGSPETVGERVVKLERSKDGVTASDLFGSRALSLDGKTYYELEYSSQSSHGQNKYATRIAINAGKLVVFTVQVKLKDVDALTPESIAILDSFRVHSPTPTPGGGQSA